MKSLPSTGLLTAVSLAATLLAAAATSGCADTAATVRKATYPPDFKYITRAELQSAMGMLARNLDRLDLALSPAQAGAPVDQEQVKRILADIDQTARGIEATSVGSNHPFLQGQMGQFRDDVALALSAASLNPPRYYAAGKLAGGCSNCHRINR